MKRWKVSFEVKGESPWIRWGVDRMRLEKAILVEEGEGVSEADILGPVMVPISAKIEEVPLPPADGYYVRPNNTAAYKHEKGWYYWTGGRWSPVADLATPDRMTFLAPLS